MEKARRKLSEIIQIKNWPKVGLDYLRRVRGKEEASRRVGGGLFNVVVRFASSKMGYTRSVESRTLEFAYLLWCEFTPDVIEYYTQPEQLRIYSEDKNGKKITTMYTPDFLLVADGKVMLVECKMESELLKIQEKNPNKYAKNIENKWVYLAAARAANEMGFTHIVVTEKDINYKLTRNIQFILGELNKLHNGNGNQDFSKIKRFVSDKQSVLLSDLKNEFSQREIFQAIIAGAIVADLMDSLLLYPETMWIYGSADVKNRHKLLKVNHSLVRVCDTQSLLDAGEFLWDDKSWRIVHVSKGKNSYINISDGEGIEKIALNKIPDFINGNNIFIKNKVVVDSDQIGKYTEKEISEAICRFNAINDKNSEIKISDKTRRRWEKAFKYSEEKYGNGFLGLISNTKNRGSKASKLSEETVMLLQDSIKNKYLRPIQSTALDAYRDFVASCKANSAPACTYQTFCKKTSAINVFKSAQLRQGHKAAHQLGPSPRKIDLINGLPAHGEFPFSVAHIDHTLVEMNFVSSFDRSPIKLRLWVTLMIDSCTRYVLGMHLSFSPPSYISVMMVLRDCVRRFNRLPLTIVSDQGSEFDSEDYEVLLAACFITKILRPKGHPRFGSVIETFFDTLQKGVIVNEMGNRRNKALGRASSASHDPEKFSCITPSEFADTLEKWLFNDYIHKPHSGIFSTPSEAMINASKSFDDNEPGIKKFNRSIFWIISLPSVDSRTLTIDRGTIHVKKIPYVLESYIHGVSGSNKFKVAVKYDPVDLSKIYALIHGKWEILKTSDHRIRQCVDRGIKLMHLEIFPKAKKYNMEYSNSLKSNNQVFSSIVNRDKHKEIYNFTENNKNSVIFSNEDSMDDEFCNFQEIPSEITCKNSKDCVDEEVSHDETFNVVYLRGNKNEHKN